MTIKEGSHNRIHKEITIERDNLQADVQKLNEELESIRKQVDVVTREKVCY